MCQRCVKIDHGGAVTREHKGSYRGSPSDRAGKFAPLSPSNNLKNKNRLFRKRSSL
nr:MAG TPA: hypothetical protein [Bacteriophage sp.]